MATAATTLDLEAQLEAHQEKELLRLVVVGSVDDGKSTLIGRLLHDTHGVYEDQLSAVKRASTQAGMEIDFSLFTDGLKAEREQGITIDVAYRYFSTEKRKFIIADTPGHIQYTRNMATGASTANVAMILIDARLGVLPQSRRHAVVASLLGIPHLAVAVNKMDLPDCGQAVFERIRDEFGEFASRLSFKDVHTIPVSALRGDNIVAPSAALGWHAGGTILDYLETVPIGGDRNLTSFRYPVQYVLRPHLDYRAFAGEIASGSVKRGDAVMVLPSRRLTRVAGVDTFEGSVPEASAPMSVAIRLEDEVDVSRGDMLVHPEDVPRVDATFEATLVWMSDRVLDPERSYLLKHTTQLVRAEFERVLGKTNLETLEHEPALTLGLNDIGRVRVHCHRPLYFDPYRENRGTGAFVVVDPLTNATLAAGMIDDQRADGGGAESDGAESDGRRASTRGSTSSLVSQSERERSLGQRGAVVLLTGLPGAGKTELARAVERALYDQGRHAIVIDPHDAISSRSAAAAQSAAELPRGALEAAERGVAAGWIVILAFATPAHAARGRIERRVGDARYVEVFVDTPKADRRRAAPDFYAEVPEPAYERPLAPELVVNPAESLARAAERVVEIALERAALAR